MASSWWQEWNAATGRLAVLRMSSPPGRDSTDNSRAPRERVRRAYAAVLRGFLAQHRHDWLARARRLGRAALRRELGLADLLQVHQQTIAPLAEDADSAPVCECLGALLAPFDKAHRDLQQTVLRLRFESVSHERQCQVLAEAQSALQAKLGVAESAREQVAAELARQVALVDEILVSQKNVKLCCNQLLLLQEEEQKRISRELDRTADRWLSLAEESVGKLSRAEPHARRRRELASVGRRLRCAAKAVQVLSREVYPKIPENMSLEFGLRLCLADFERRTGVDGRFHCRGSFEGLDRTTRLLLYRLAQETFWRIMPHGHSTHVDMDLQRVNGSVEVQIKVGDAYAALRRRTERAPERHHWLMLQERVRLLNGQFVAEDHNGGGLTVRMALPLRIQDASHDGKDQCTDRR